MTPLEIHHAVDLAIQHQQAGRVQEAERIYRQILADDPGNVDALNLLGVIQWQAGRRDNALELIRRAIAIQPRYAEAHYNLGNALLGKGMWDEAIAAFGRAVALKPGFWKAHVDLASALHQQGRLDEAIAAWKQVVALKGDDPANHMSLGNCLMEKECLDEAIAAYRQCIALNPGDWNPYYALGKTLEIQGKIAEATAAFQAARERAPTGTVSGYYLAALGGVEAPPASPREYLIDYFDAYAGHFDQHLVKRLEYRGPQLLLDAVTAAAPKPDLDILDLGCGTGLCGALFRPMARRLIGVDLSPRMIEKARQRGDYDELREMDLTVALEERPRSVDLILAADVFIYVGRLDEVIESAARALRPAGLFAFTIESLDAGDYCLRPTRRYAQSLAYIRRLAMLCRFTEVSAQPAVLRKNLDQPVDGFVIVLRAMG